MNLNKWLYYVKYSIPGETLRTESLVSQLSCVGVAVYAWSKNSGGKGRKIGTVVAVVLLLTIIIFTSSISISSYGGMHWQNWEGTSEWYNWFLVYFLCNRANHHGCSCYCLCWTSLLTLCQHLTMIRQKQPLLYVSEQGLNYYLNHNYWLTCNFLSVGVTCDDWFTSLALTTYPPRWI